jgi:hypothetical protein
MQVAQSAAFEAVFESGETGLVGTLEVAVIDNDDVVIFGPTSVGIIENEVGGTPTGIYTAELTAPGDVGQYSIVWSLDGSFEPDSVSSEDLIVSTASALDGTLPAIEAEDGGPSYGPCTAWTTVEDIEAFCNTDSASVLVSGSELDEALTMSAATSSQILYELSGQQFSGLCQQTVRPCRSGCVCGYQVLSRGHIVNWGGSGWLCDERTPCGCSALSKITLAGYPVREVVEVKIDGDVVDPTTYRMDAWRHLVRLDGAQWPGCQTLDLPDTEEGTFSVTYTYGQTPPQMAKDAATALACEIYRSFNGLECALPVGATRVTRQGITIERTFFQRDGNLGVWRTGIPAVDGFLNSVNPYGLRRRPTVWSPSFRYPWMANT